MNKLYFPIAALLLACVFCFKIHAQEVSLSCQSQLAQLKKEWAVAKYKTPKKHQDQCFKELIQHAKHLSDQYPHSAQVALWHGTVLSTYASKKGGMGALKMVKEAKSLVEKALLIDQQVEQGMGQAVMGALYSKVPSWPLSFGDKEKAKQYLKTAVDINPFGLDSNFYYADFLMSQGDVKGAKKYFNQALQAKFKVDQPEAEFGRRQEISLALMKIQEGKA